MSTPNTTLYIKNLNDHVQKEELKAQLYSLFTAYGKILDIVASKSTKMRGQAFLVFADLASATTAMRACEGMLFYDKPMHIEYAKTKSYAVLMREDPNFIHPTLSKKSLASTQLTNGKRGREEEDSLDDRSTKREKPDEEDEMEIEDEETRPPITENGHTATSVLLCTNLPQEVTDDMIAVLFQQYQGFQSTQVAAAPNPGPNGPTKLARVIFDSPDLCSVAKEALDGFTLKRGWQMSVQYISRCLYLCQRISSNTFSRDQGVRYLSTCFLTFTKMAAAIAMATLNEHDVYHRIVSSSIKVPTDTANPVPVGLLACQRDPLLKELTTWVIQCQESQGPEAPKDKKKKPQSVQGEPVVEVLLHDSILFPEGGGQPSDIGFMESSEGDVWHVLEVRRRGHHAIHYVRCGKILPPGSLVKVYLGTAGFHRRYDHMCMHTSQHLISALLEKKLQLPTPSWYMTQYPAPAYIEVPRIPSAEELQSIEDEANDICISGTKVYVEVDDLHSKQENEDERNNKNLPIDYTGNVNRIVVIDGVDRNPCCGTHLPSLLGISIFILPQVEPLSRGRGRIFFCAGPRVRAYLSKTHGLLTEAATGYGCAIEQIPERLTFETDGRRKGSKRVDELEAELAAYIVKDLEKEYAALPTGQTKFVSFKHHMGLSSNPLNFLTTIQSEWKAVPASSTPYLLLLAESQKAEGYTVVLIVGSDEGDVKKLGDKFKAEGVKGGGKGGKWSGKTDKWKGDEWAQSLLDQNM
ncbi:hypothetical protein Clacol_001797 [Clathrus columnatus]|uniref:RRM domain-containing protein n=1 Tax=Clathrus columnatus TaxID=1419009 RepID=A0AAV5A2V7_9AGAM|nr:hypothetical protein Clacol_001797 [Clathrus columnatus]